MAEPISWQLIQSVVGFINSATRPSAYFDWKGSSELWQLNEDDLDSVESVSGFQAIAYVVADDDTTDEVYSKASSDTINLTIEAYVRLGSDEAQLTAHRVRSDLRKCIPKRIVGVVPKGVHSLEVQNVRVLQKPEGIPFVVVQLRLRASLLDT